MMDDQFRIYIEQLKKRGELSFREELSPDFIEVSEQALSFPSPVILRGTASIADKELLVVWDIDTTALIPCKICNAPVVVPVCVRRFYHSEPLAELKSGIYDFRNLLRETILLETPRFAECGGACPERATLSRYASPGQSPDVQHPFASLKVGKKQ